MWRDGRSREDGITPAGRGLAWCRDEGRKGLCSRTCGAELHGGRAGLVNTLGSVPEDEASLQTEKRKNGIPSAFQTLIHGYVRGSRGALESERSGEGAHGAAVGGNKVNDRTP